MTQKESFLSRWKDAPISTEARPQPTLQQGRQPRMSQSCLSEAKSSTTRYAPRSVGGHCRWRQSQTPRYQRRRLAGAGQTLEAPSQDRIATICYNRTSAHVSRSGGTKVPIPMRRETTKGIVMDMK